MTSARVLAAVAGAAAVGASVAGAAYEGCAFTQPCDQTFDPTCHPINATGTMPYPFNNNGVIFPSPPQCPNYVNATCCTGNQNKALATNFLLIYAGFFATGGNMACVKNLEDFWCAFTCAPDQGRFVDVTGYANMTDPTSGQEYLVLQTNIRVSRYYACGVWESCKHTFTSELASLRTCENFFSYLVSQAINHGSFSTYTYVDGNDTAGLATALDQPLYDCCSVPADFDNPGAGNTTSPCAYCGGMCPGSSDVCYTTGGGPNEAGGGGGGNATGAAIDTVTLTALYGAQWGTIIGVYAAIGALTVAYHAWQCACRLRAAKTQAGEKVAADGDAGSHAVGDDEEDDEDDPMADEWAAGAHMQVRASFLRPRGSGAGGEGVERDPIYSMPFVSPGAGRQYTPIDLAAPSPAPADVPAAPAVRVAT